MPDSESKKESAKAQYWLDPESKKESSIACEQIKRSLCATIEYVSKVAQYMPQYAYI